MSAPLWFASTLDFVLAPLWFASKEEVLPLYRLCFDTLVVSFLFGIRRERLFLIVLIHGSIPSDFLLGFLWEPWPFCLVGDCLRLQRPYLLPGDCSSSSSTEASFLLASKLCIGFIHLRSLCLLLHHCAHWLPWNLSSKTRFVYNMFEAEKEKSLVQGFIEFPLLDLLNCLFHESI